MRRAAPQAPAGRDLAPGDYYGRILDVRRATDLVLTELEHPGRRVVPGHAHTFAFFSLLLAGDYRERCASRTIEYRPFTLAFHPPGTAHRDEIGNLGGRFFSIEVGPSWLERGRVAGMRFAPGVDLQGGAIVWLALALYRESRRGDDCAALACEETVLAMLDVTADAAPCVERSRPAWLRRVEERLVAEFRERPRLDTLAAEAGVHAVHLARVFRGQHGHTIGEHVRRLRVRDATERLTQRDARLAEIACSAGFADQAHMTRAFRQVTGTTPAVLRAALTRERGCAPAAHR